MDAAEMKRIWEAPVSGSRHIARNYIPESLGVDMVAYCEARFRPRNGRP